VAELELFCDLAALPDRTVAGARVRVRDGQVVDVVAAPAPAAARRIAGTLLPGFVDLQVNGAGGRSVAEATPDALEQVAQAVWDGGAVAFLPTLITAPWDVLLRQVTAVAEWIGSRDSNADGAEPLGLHVEGPFLEVAGAHDAAALIDPTPERIAALIDAARGRLRLVTLASSRPGAAAAVDRLRQAGVTVALGHVADPRGFDDCVAAGATAVTHLFNAMGAMHHREPGVAGRCLDEPRLSCCLIADGVHVHPSIVRLAFATLSTDRTVLVTDATAAAAMPDGEYRLSGATVRASGGVVRDAAGHLAGSALTMAQAARGFLSMVPGAGPWTLARIASTNPAALACAASYGAVESGRRAAFTVVDEDGAARALRIRTP